MYAMKLAVVWDSTAIQAHLSPAHTELILAMVMRVREAVGFDGRCVQRDNFWPTAHETFAVVAQDHRVFTEGQSILQDQGHTAMLTCLRHVEETVVPVTRPCVGGSLSLSNANDESPPHGLVSGHECPLSPRSVGRSQSHVTP